MTGSVRAVDLNCDMGESFGVYELGHDEELLSSVTSANIACGFHAGDPLTMRRTVVQALARGVAVGAHPGLPDLAGFGRREMAIGAEEAYAICVYQIGALAAMTQAEGGRLAHVKPHGALYNMAARNAALAEAIAEAVCKVDASLVLFGLAGSELIRAGAKLGLRTASEAFADRSYESDGSLTSRTLPDGLLHNSEEAAARVIRMVREGVVRSRQGDDIPLAADTVCIHGDGPEAVRFARAVRERLQAAGIAVRALSRG